MDLDALSPMYDAGDQHFYVFELTRLRNGLFIIPFWWVTYHKQVHAESWKVVCHNVSFCKSSSDCSLANSHSLG